MVERYEQQGVVWIDAENPTPEEIETIAQEFNLAPLLSQELLAPTLKPRVDLYPDLAFFVLHFPASRHTHGSASAQEVDIVLGKGFMVSVHYDTIAAIYDLSRSFEAAMLLHKNSGKFHSGHVLFELAQRLYQEVEYELDAIEDSISVIESAIFSGRERDMVAAISGVSRELLNQKRSLATHADILGLLEQSGPALFGETFKTYLRGVSAFHFRAQNRVLALTDTVVELRKTNDSLLNAHQNEIMKNLTIMAFVTYPLTLVAGLFGMNTTYTPIVGLPNGFWIISALMVVLGVVFFLYFKLKRWF